MATQTAPNNSYLHGHRERLRSRFLERGEQALADYEMLELLLMQAIPRRDVKPLAKDLLKQFKTFAGVLNAPANELKKLDGIGDSVIMTLKLAVGISDVYRRSAAKQGDVFNNRIEMLDYLYTRMSPLQHEEFHVIYLDSKNRIIHDECLFRGTINQSAVYPREVIKSALNHGAAGIVITHNHPSGNPEPSMADELITADIAALALNMGITVQDHIIIGHDRHYSFAENKKL